MNILIVYPRHSIFGRISKYLLNINFSHLVILNIESMLPREWNKKLIDMNSEELSIKDILWSDYTIIYAARNQRKSAAKILDKCKELNTKTIGCGSLFDNTNEHYDRIAPQVYNEAELTLPQFLYDMRKVNPKQKYSSEDYPNVSASY